MLGDLAVVLEERIGKAGRAWDDSRLCAGHDLDANGVERIDRGEVEIGGEGAADALPGAAQRLEDDEPRLAKATGRQ